MTRTYQATLYVVALLLMISSVNTAFGGDAQISQIENLQKRALQGGNADVTRSDNVQAGKLEAGNTDVTRNNNLLGLQLKSGDADISRDYNLLGLQLSSQDVDITQSYNLLGLKLGPNNADVTTNNNLLALPLEQALLPQVNVVNLLTTDQSGNVKTNFHTGGVAQIRFTIQNIGSVNLPRGLVSVTILDPSRTPIFLAYTFDDIKIAGSKEFVFGLTIPYDAVSGEYTAKALVFTKWPYEGGEPLAVGTITFNVSI